MHFFLPLILAQTSIIRSGCCNKKITAVLIILLHLMSAKALNESEDKYFSNKTDVSYRGYTLYIGDLGDMA